MSPFFFAPNRLLLLCACAFMAQGCSTGKRWGEARIEHRRYSKGWHVNVPHESKIGRTPSHANRAEEVSPELSASTKGDDLIEMDVQQVSEWERPLIEQAASLRSMEEEGSAFRKEVKPGDTSAEEQEPVARVASTVEADLPEPIMGRHPDAVPGFLLSLGWLYGAIGATALEYLLIPAVGFALFLGWVMSVIGYRMSRRAYRTARSHPERYPRNGLSRAARWVAGAPLLAVGLWLALVFLFVFLSG